MKMRTTFLTALLLMALVFSLSAQLERDVFGSNSRPELCWAIYQEGEGLSLETLRFYSFPPAWKDEQQRQKDQEWLTSSHSTNLIE